MAIAAWWVAERLGQRTGTVRAEFERRLEVAEAAETARVAALSRGDEDGALAAQAESVEALSSALAIAPEGQRRTLELYLSRIRIDFEHAVLSRARVRARALLAAARAARDEDTRRAHAQEALTLLEEAMRENHRNPDVVALVKEAEAALRG